MIRRRSVCTQPRVRNRAIAFATASRDAPAHEASSSWVIAEADVDPGLALGAVAVAQLDQPPGDAHDDVVDGVVDALAVGLAQARGDRAQQHERDPRAAARGTPGTRCRG